MRKGVLVHGDGLEQHGSMGLQEAIAGCKIGVVLLEAHGLEHLDRDDLVVPTFQSAVVLKEKSYPRIGAAAQSGFGKPCGGVIMLFPADGRGGNAAAIAGGSVDGESPPSGA